MVRIIKPFGGATVNGSIGSVCFASGRAGTVARLRSKPTNSKSERRTAAHFGMQLANDTWTNRMTTAEREAWSLYAKLTPILKRKSRSAFLSGRDHYMRVNLPRLAMKPFPTFIRNAPKTPGIAPSQVIKLSATTATGLLVDSITPIMTFNSLFFFKVSPPLGVDANAYHGSWSLNIVANAGIVLPFVLKPLVKIGQRYFVSFVRHDSRGKASSESLFSVNVES